MTTLATLGVKPPRMMVRMPAYAPPPFVPRHARAAAVYQAIGAALRQLGDNTFSGDVESTLSLPASTVYRAAQNPAATNAPGWAAELVQDLVAAMHTDMSNGGCLLLQVAPQPLTWGKFSSLIVPMRKPRAGTQGMAASFRAEGDPIRIGGAPLQGKALKPHSLGVIATWTNELAGKTVEELGALVRTWVTEDTSAVLDGLAWSDSPANGPVPAGLLAALPAQQRVISGGNTVDDMQADMTALMQAFIATGPAKGYGVFVMHPSRFIALQTARNAAGLPIYPETQHGVLQRLPILTSINVPPGTVVLVDQADVQVALEWKGWKASIDATLHEDDSSPLPIVNAAGVPAAPVRSLFQSNAQALRALWDFDALLPRGRAAYVTGATW